MCRDGKDFAEDEEGRQEWRTAFNTYAGDFAYSHVCTETVKGRMGAVGMWGDYCEREGHGKYVEWQRKAFFVVHGARLGETWL